MSAGLKSCATTKPWATTSRCTLNDCRTAPPFRRMAARRHGTTWECDNWAIDGSGAFARCASYGDPRARARCASYGDPRARARCASYGDPRARARCASYGDPRARARCASYSVQGRLAGAGGRGRLWIGGSGPIFYTRGVSDDSSVTMVGWRSGGRDRGNHECARPLHVGAFAHGVGFGVPDCVGFGLPTTFAQGVGFGVPRR
jgi:hypothetical protein